jgi:uncharacterized protein YdhG (YjbR/CyaY superfamily)
VLKTTRTGASVAKFLGAITDEQVRQDCLAISALMSDVTGAKPEMWGSSIVGFGTRNVVYADGRELPWPQIAFSPRARYIALYLTCEGDLRRDLLVKLGPHSGGKSCLYIKRLSDVHVPTLKTLVQISVRRLQDGRSGPNARQPKRAPGPARRQGRMASGRAPESVDAYLATLPADKRAALETLRQDIRRAAPGAEECISYGVPGYRLDGKLLVHFGAGTKHCAFYPGAVVEAFKADLAHYDTSKGTIRFSSDRPLPAKLVRAIVKAQVTRRAARR